MSKNIVITGASSGIGAALATAYAAPDATLLLIARDAARLDEAAQTARAKGAAVETARIDVTDAEAMAKALEAQGIECMIDDRKGSVGSKLKDSDIIGFPLRVVFGRDLKDGKVEVFNRLTDEKDTKPIADAEVWVADFVKAELSAAEERCNSVPNPWYE